MRYSVAVVFFLLFSLPSPCSLFGKDDDDLGVVAVGEAEVGEREGVDPSHASGGKGWGRFCQKIR